MHVPKLPAGTIILKIPPPIWALAYLLIALGISYLTGSQVVPGLPIVPLAVALVALGLALAISTGVLFWREGTEINPTSPSNRKLVTSGPFKLSRNPIYLGLAIVTLGIAFWVGTWPMFLVPVATFATVNWVHIPFEEAKMRNQFREEFDRYVRQVRRWI